MCGIVGYVGTEQAIPILLAGLSKLEYRGYDSSGIAVYDNGTIKMEKAKGRLKNLEDKLNTDPLEGYIGIGHTRWATHGAPSDMNAHPHISNNVAVVHNGIIENYMSLKDELIKYGYEFTSDTDTETIAHLIDYYYKNGYPDILDALIKTISRLEGSYALGVLCKDDPERILAIRKDSPLVIGLGETENFIASDIPAILNYTRNAYLLDDKEIAILTKDAVNIVDIHKNAVNKEVFKIDWNVEAAEKGGFEHFMIKEIYDQPKVIRDMIAGRLKEDHINLSDIAFNLDKFKRVYVVACGTAYYAGLILKHMLQQMARIPVIGDVASEFRYNDPILDENTLLIVISQSGETADTVAALRLAKQNKTPCLAIVNVVGSSIARESDAILYTLAGPEISVASTKAFSSQLVAAYLIAGYFAMQKGCMNIDQYKEYKKCMEELPDLTDAIIQRAGEIEKIAQKYLSAKNVFYIGRGMDYLISLEGSLKLKEIAYLHSEPYAAGELKHGPIALIEDSTLVIGIVTQEHLLEKTMSNLKECKARGARIFAIAMEGNREIEQVADDIFYIPRTSALLVALLANIPQQLFAYYMALGLGNDIDKPRNLAKSVTVE